MLINGKEYPWASMEIVISGKPLPLETVIAISYTAEQEHNHLHAKRRDPYGLTAGNKTYSGSITLLQSEVEALQKRMADMKDITDMRGVNITVAYLPDGEPGQIVTDSIIDIRVERLQKGMRTGDGNMEVELPFKCLKVMFNI